jgi:hypothetical protein
MVCAHHFEIPLPEASQVPIAPRSEAPTPPLRMPSLHCLDLRQTELARQASAD